MAASAVLVKKGNKQHIPIYFVGRFLTGPQLNYPNIKKFILALTIATRLLRHYFEAHLVKVLTYPPLKKMT